MADDKYVPTRLFIETESGLVIEFPKTECSLTLYFIQPSGQKSIFQIPFSSLLTYICPDVNGPIEFPIDTDTEISLFPANFLQNENNKDVG